MTRWWWCGPLAALALASGAASAQTPAPAPSDSSLHRFLDSLADSTDAYFGLITAPVDTSGLDSTLAARLDRAWRDPRRRTRWSVWPVAGFNRVDGSVTGARLTLRNRGERARLALDLERAFGARAWLGGGELTVGRRRHGVLWRARIAAGRRTTLMDRDDAEPLAGLQALVWGADRQNYLRRDGVTVGLDASGITWQAQLEYRDRLESPLTVRKAWNLSHRALADPDNLAAAFGRARELSLEALTRVPGTLFRFQLGQALADRALGSDFDYRRWRAVLAGELAAGRHLSFVPQLGYGRLAGDPVPQAAFYLGGPTTLRSLATESRAGTGMAIGRLDIVVADDLLELVHLPHPAMFPLQAGVFAAGGAVFGRDPFGGPGSVRDGWPDRNAWRSEAGVSLLYRPGLPDPDGYLRLNLAWPLGPTDAPARWSVSYTRALDLLKPF